MSVDDFILEKIDQLEQAIRAREEAERTWRAGTDASWRKVGCRRPKKERQAIADREARILAKLRRELALYNKVLEVIIAKEVKQNDQQTKS